MYISTSISRAFFILSTLLCLGSYMTLNFVLAETTRSTSKQNKPSEENLEQARELFTERCVSCHGARGDGKGMLAANLNPRPANLRSNVWYRSTTPKKIKRVILGGGGALGKSILMPANPDLRTKPKLVNALVYYIIHLVDRDPKKR